MTLGTRRDITRTWDVIALRFPSSGTTLPGDLQAAMDLTTAVGSSNNHSSRCEERLRAVALARGGRFRLGGDRRRRRGRRPLDDDDAGRDAVGNRRRLGVAVDLGADRVDGGLGEALLHLDDGARLAVEPLVAVDVELVDAVRARVAADDDDLAVGVDAVALGAFDGEVAVRLGVVGRRARRTAREREGRQRRHARREERAADDERQPASDTRARRELGRVVRVGVDREPHGAAANLARRTRRDRLARPMKRRELAQDGLDLDLRLVLDVDAHGWWWRSEAVRRWEVWMAWLRRLVFGVRLL
mmetsp:Transcript_3915/g.15596  ORF Transcript_3915/g.15596 Transcript_3915/m.15596 type:complete len:302 (-) Transcript_3915:7-912(-)